MEALNAVGVKPLSVVAKTSDPKKSSPPATISPSKNPNFSNSKCEFSAPRILQGGLVILSSFLSSELAKALTVDEALQLDFDAGGVFDNAVSFAAENPTIVGGAAAAAAAPLVVALLSRLKPWGVESAKGGFEKLGDDSNAQLLDIRSAVEIKNVGTPDLRGLKKKAAAIMYNGEDKQGFLKKLFVKFKEPENTTLFILDTFDGNSEAVAELVTSNGFKAAYAIKDGAEGSRGWINSGLPWVLPKKTLDLSNLADAIGDAFGEASDSVPVALGVAAAAAGLGLLAFTEVETILQILGSAALLQFASKKLLFAEDRKQTMQEIEELLSTKVAPNELVEDVQQIGKALLPTQRETAPAPSQTTVLTSDVPSKAEPQVEEKPLPELSRPLSPYPNYPDYKPPSSPMPSQP
ncbi:hypothetical protein ACS0TY_019207 [Phlomoides rotata]